MAHNNLTTKSGDFSISPLSESFRPASCCSCKRNIVQRFVVPLVIYVLVQNIHRCQNHPYYRRKRPFPAQIRRLPQVLYCIPAPVVGGIFVILLPTSIPSLIYSAHAVHLIIFVQMNSCLPPKVHCQRKGLD